MTIIDRIEILALFVLAIVLLWAAFVIKQCTADLRKEIKFMKEETKNKPLRSDIFLKVDELE